MAVMEQVEVAERVAARRRPRFVAGMVACAGAAVVTSLYLTVPKGNEGTGPVDALVVLGTPANRHGHLTEMQGWRVDEALREFRAGKAPRIVFSGGPAANQFVEADVMAAYAQTQGIPSAAIFEERDSKTTIQNVANTSRLLEANGWHSVEVISTGEHLPRAAVLLEKTGLAWRVQAAPTPGRRRLATVGAYAEEAFGTAVLRVFGTRAEPVLHALAMTQHRITWCGRWVVYRVEDLLGR